MRLVRGVAWRLMVLAAAASLAAVLLAACGGGGGSNSGSGSTTTGSSGGGSSTVNVSEKEWQITVGSTTLTKGNGNAPLKAGTVTFNIKNDGTIAHALEIKGQGIDKKTGNIDPGKTEKLTVTLKPGKYEIWCPIPGHKENGMDGYATAS